MTTTRANLAARKRARRKAREKQRIGTANSVGLSRWPLLLAGAMAIGDTHMRHPPVKPGGDRER